MHAWSCLAPTIALESGGRQRSTEVKRNGLTKTLTCLGHKKVDIVLAFGTRPRTLRFRVIFIDFWLDMIKLAAKAADRHLAYFEASMRQDIERRSSWSRGRRSMHSLRLTVGFRKPPDEDFVHQSTQRKSRTSPGK